ncbi:hypothetical protein ACRS8P_29695 [Burkholderia cenocepacia]
MNAYTFATPFEKTAAPAPASVAAPSAVFFSPLHGAFSFQPPKETLINGPTSEVAGEMASNFLDDEANRRSIQ